MNVSSNMNYSNSGKTLATTYYNSAKAIDGYNWEAKREILKDGFDTISRDCQVTEDEKALASLGKAVGSHSMTNDDAAKARYNVMSAIFNATGGPVGAVLAKVAYDSAKAIDGNSWESKRTILKDGFDAISQNYKTSQDEKALAELGKAVGSHTMTNDDAAKARYVVMNAIACASGGPIGNVIARVSYDAAKAIDGCSWESKRAILKDGFEAILQNPNSSQTAKTLAQQGIKVGANSMPNDDAAKARYSIMQSIINLQ